MTGEQLRDELERIAAAAPHVEVPDDLFARGRRATARARVLAGAAVVACLGLVGAVVVPLVASDDRPGFADREAYEQPGVPDHIYAPDPEGSGTGLPMTPLDELAPLVAAYVVDPVDAVAVVVTVDGDYLATRLPGHHEPMMDEISPLLSPDGLHLAYLSDVDDRRGLSILDVRTGDVRVVRLPGEHGTYVRTMQWSPDGRSLVWSGQELATRTDNGASYRQRIVGGLVRDRFDDRVFPPDRLGWDGAGVCNGGGVVRYRWPSYVVGSRRTRSWAEVQRENGPCAAPAGVVRLEQGTRLLGWLPVEPDDRAPTAVVLDPDEDEDGSWSTSTLGLLEPGGEVAPVGTVDSVGLQNLSVATWRMSADRPTVPAGENPWGEPWWKEDWLPLTLLVVIGIGFATVAWRVRKAVKG